METICWDFWSAQNYQVSNHDPATTSQFHATIIVLICILRLRHISSQSNFPLPKLHHIFSSFLSSTQTLNSSPTPSPLRLNTYNLYHTNLSVSSSITARKHRFITSEAPLHFVREDVCSTLTLPLFPATAESPIRNRTKVNRLVLQLLPTANKFWSIHSSQYCTL